MRLSLWQEHKQEWQGCTRCDLSKGRRKVCLARGSIPAEILFVGQAPGESENVVGQPFVGPAGSLLDYIIKQSIGSTHTYAITNLVGCIPRDPEDGNAETEPPMFAIEACSPRLKDFVEFCNPKLIVTVGSMSRDWLKPGYKHSINFHVIIPQVHIEHPAYILRLNVAQRGLKIQRSVVTVANAIEEHLTTRESDK